MNIVHSGHTLSHSLQEDKGSFWKVIWSVTVLFLLDGIKDRKVREKTIIRDHFRTDQGLKKGQIRVLIILKKMI